MSMDFSGYDTKEKSVGQEFRCWCDLFCPSFFPSLNLIPHIFHSASKMYSYICNFHFDRLEYDQVHHMFPNSQQIQDERQAEKQVFSFLM